MQTIARTLAAVTEDYRSDTLWNVETAARIFDCSPKKFIPWWKRTEEKLIELFIAMPGPTAAMLAVLLAKAEQERQSRTEKGR